MLPRRCFPCRKTDNAGLHTGISELYIAVGVTKETGVFMTPKFIINSSERVLTVVELKGDYWRFQSDSKD
ncbi:MAG: hypothetical protein K0U93_09140 [Gammaproteobacteria bacterium]|nr:hypothetical protein [Gammaproteobacteria bacterium]